MSAPVMEIQYEHLTVRENRNGTKRYYFRRRGQPLTRLPSPSEPEFSAEYHKCLNWVAPGAHAYEGTFAWACDEYMNSPDFKAKAPATQSARRRIILSMMKEPLKRGCPETFGDEKVSEIGKVHIEILRDRKADNPHAANERLKILSRVFKLALAREWVEVNLIRDVERVKIPRGGGHETATDADIEAYLAKHTEGPAHLAMLILRHTGVRVSDLRVLGRQHIQNGYLVFDTVKTGVRCELQIGPDLMVALPRTNMTFLLTESGVPFASDKALSQRVAKWFRQAGVRGITAHGVRKWLATKMAEDGSTEYQLCSWFGWQDPKEARPYVRAANRRLMADEAYARRSSV